MAAGPAIGGRPGTRARRTVVALAITQTVGYGTLYYSFAIFLTPLAADLRTTTTAVTGTFTAAVLAAAALAVPVGRWLDRHGGRALMTGGSLLGALLLVAWSRVDSLWQLYAVQVGLGVAGAASLYEAAFAVIIAGTSPRHRANALLTVTVVAGFASTIFLPLTGRLVEQYGWRTALVLLAAIQALLTVPLHATALRAAPPAGGAAGRPDRRARRTTPPAGSLDRRARRTAAPAGSLDRPARCAASSAGGVAGSPERSVRLRVVLADRGFWLLAIGFTANTAAIALVTVHLVAALVSWGHPLSFAATAAGLFGVLSVTGRLATTALQRRFRTTTVVAVVFAVQAVAVAMLPVIGRTAAGAIAGVVGFGLGFGVATIAKPVLIAGRYDTRRYATIAATLVVPVTIAKATAPLGAAALLNHAGGYTGMFLATAVLCTIAAAALGITREPPPRAPSPQEPPAREPPPREPPP